MERTFSTKQHQQRTTFFTLRLNTSRYISSNVFFNVHRDRPFFGRATTKETLPYTLLLKWEAAKWFRVCTNLVKSLHWAVENGQIDVCKDLLRKLNSHKDTALHYAVRGGHDLVVELLIKEDPQLCDITNAADESPLYIAVHRGLSSTFELILDAFSLSSSHKGPKGLTALHAAVHSSGTWWSKILEKRPEVIREGDDLGWTPLHYFACKGTVEAVQLLLQHDTSVAYVVDKEGQSALHIAAFEGYVNVIDELLRSCPDACDTMNTKGQTALHAAVIGGQVNMVQHILGLPNLEHLINEQDNDRNTALHLAALHKMHDIICVLARDRRVDHLATNKDHLTAREIFDLHKEVGYRAAKVQYVMKNYFGCPGYRGWVIEYVKKGIDKQLVEDQPAVFTTTGSNLANRENFDLSKKSIIDLQVLAAVLIATVTFAATFTMPGGYNNDRPNQGMATLASKVAFQVFVISNTIAFSFSIVAIFLQLDTSMGSVSVFQHRYIRMAGNCIFVAIVGMGLAFACGTYVVLTQTTGLGITPFVIFACLVIMYWIGGTLEPQALYGRLRDSLGRYVRNMLFDYDIL